MQIGVVSGLKKKSYKTRDYKNNGNKFLILPILKEEISNFIKHPNQLDLISPNQPAAKCNLSMYKV